jgi:cation:H+ antiporter
MIISILMIAAGLVLLYYGADFLVRGASALALAFGITPLVIGLTVVAFGTSAPELVVSVRSTWTSQGAIALGNVVGSNICNIALILGLTAMITPLNVNRQVVRMEIPIMILASLALVVVLRDGIISRFEGGFFFLCIIIYTTFSVYKARREKKPLGEEDVMAVVKITAATSGRNIGLVILGLVLLFAGGDLLVRGAVDMASRLSIPQAIIGLTVVAVGTSLPELATSVVAAMKKEADIAVGNVIGSNIFNILSILGLSSMIRPIQTGGVTWGSLWAMVGAAILALPFMWTGFRLSRWEGFVLLGMYIAYVVYLIVLVG